MCFVRPFSFSPVLSFKFPAKQSELKQARLRRACLTGDSAPHHLFLTFDGENGKLKRPVLSFLLLNFCILWYYI